MDQVLWNWLITLPPDDLFIIQKFFETRYLTGDINLINSGNLESIFADQTYDIETLAVTRYLPSDDPSVTDSAFPAGNPGDPVSGGTFYDIGMNHYLTQKHPQTTSNRHKILGEMIVWGRSTF